MAKPNFGFNFLKKHRSFPFVCAVSAHSPPIRPEPYRVISGPYQVKRFPPGGDDLSL